jgi:hypothetical protein
MCKPAQNTGHTVPQRFPQCPRPWGEGGKVRGRHAPAERVTDVLVPRLI